MAVDALAPGYAPFKDFGITADVGKYISSFEDILKYDFDFILTGHLSFLGNRADVVETRDYVRDVEAAVINAITTKPLPVRFGETFAAMGNAANGYLVFRYVIESVAKECSARVIDKWKHRLAAVDVWADGHCETMLLHIYNTR